MTKKRNNFVKRQWRREVHNVLTADSQALHRIFTDLLSTERSFAAQPLTARLRAYMREMTADLWSAARLGWHHATVQRRLYPRTKGLSRPERLLIQAAYDAGQRSLKPWLEKRERDS